MLEISSEYYLARFFTLHHLHSINVVEQCHMSNLSVSRGAKRKEKWHDCKIKEMLESSNRVSEREEGVFIFVQSGRESAIPDREFSNSSTSRL
jgi:hypothetical protein